MSLSAKMAAADANIELELQKQLAVISTSTAARVSAQEGKREQPTTQAPQYGPAATGASVDQTQIHPSLRAAPAPVTSTAPSYAPTANMMPAPPSAPAPVAPVASIAPSAAAVDAAAAAIAVGVAPQPPASPAPAPTPSVPQLGVAHIPGTPVVVAPAPPATTPIQQQQQQQLQPLGTPPLSDGRRAKRELSTSKRAAQNRAAQRAFRQRKEQYIKKLEEQVREYENMEKNYKTLQTDNYLLREYVVRLQSHIMEREGEYPAPPANLSVQQPGHQQVNNIEGVAPAQNAPNSSLEAIAQAVADAGIAPSGHLAQPHPQDPQDDAAMDTTMDDSIDDSMDAEVARQLKAEIPQAS